MPRNGVLIDTGPIVAIFSDRDIHHLACVEEAKRLRGRFLTSWSVITEAAHLLKHDPAAVHKLLSWVKSPQLSVLQLQSDDLDGITKILDQYADQSFDFADATLMHLAEREDVTTVFTLDHRHFSIFRSKGHTALRLAPATL